MLFYLVLIFILFSSYKIYTFAKCPKELEHIPSAPFWSFFIFSLSKKAFDEKMEEKFQPLIDEYGVIRVFTFMGWTLVIGDPKICKEISMKHEIFEKPDFTILTMSKLGKKFIGPSQLVSNNGEEWKRHRKIINPIFNKTWSTQMFGSCVQDLINEWESHDGEEVKVHDNIQRMALDVLGKAIFDIDFKAVKDPNSGLFNLYNDIVHQIFEQPLYMIFPFLEYIPYFKRTKLSKQLDEYNQFVDDIIKLRKQEFLDSAVNQSDNLITALVKSNENNHESKLTLDEIRENIKIFIVGGHDTTSNTLTSTLYYLARYPEIQDKLRNEILNALDNPNQVSIPNIEQLKKIPYMDLVNKESMRIVTTAGAIIQRTTAENHTLSNGIAVPKGTHVILHLWGIHHNSSAFPKPNKFNPDRFKDLSNEESRNWQPLMTGTRSCIGITFSMMEQRVTIAMLLQKFEFTLTNDNPDYHKLRLSPDKIIRPDNLSITIKVRQ